MNKSINILLLAVALLAVQACGSKSEKEQAAKEAELEAIKTPAAEATSTPTLEERRLAAEKSRVALAEKRKFTWEERVKASVTYKDSDGNLIYNKAEVDPSFDGGEKAMNAFFRDNVKFPESAAEEGLDGTVYIDFVVSPD